MITTSVLKNFMTASPDNNFLFEHILSQLSSQNNHTKKQKSYEASLPIKNKVFWIALIPALLLLVQTVCSVFGIELDFGNLRTSCSPWSTRSSRCWRFSASWQTPPLRGCVTASGQ